MNKQTFDGWMARVDAIVEARCGLSTADLPDCCFADWYEDGCKPSTAAARAIRSDIFGED